MSPAFKHQSRTLFTAAAAVVLGLQVAPWPSSIEAQEKAPAPLFVQAQARPISQSAPREKQQYNNPQRPAQPAPQQPQQQRTGAPQRPKTEVQLELEKLYEQNGREAPEMVDPKFSESATGQPAGMQPSQPAQTQTYQAAPVSAPKKKGLLSKLFGKKDEGPSQPPAEPPYVPSVAAPPATPPAALSGPPAKPSTGLQNYGQLFNQPGSAGAAPQQPQQFVQQPSIQPAQVQPPVLNAPPAVSEAAPADQGFEAPLFVETPVAPSSNGLPAIDFNAPLDEPKLDAVDLGQPAPLTVAAAPAKPADPFSDDALFPGTTAVVAPDLSVTVEAAPVEQALPEVEADPVEENPYSGLTLDSDPFSNPSALRAATATPREIPLKAPSEFETTTQTSPPALMVPPTEPNESPLDMVVRPAQTLVVPNPQEASDEPPLVVDQTETTPPAQLSPAPRLGNERTRAKQEMIAARKGLRGLKGFCPVILREDRDLVDAHSQFRVVYNSKTYYLSSSQAVTEFQSDPAKYAPAARGCDVIHQAITGEDLEGTLDFAVWYKGRLYLFSSAETMDTFVSAPSSHATLD